MFPSASTAWHPNLWQSGEWAGWMCVIYITSMQQTVGNTGKMVHYQSSWLQHATRLSESLELENIWHKTICYLSPRLFKTYRFLGFIIYLFVCLIFLFIYLCGMRVVLHNIITTLLNSLWWSYRKEWKNICCSDQIIISCSDRTFWEIF